MENKTHPIKSALRIYVVLGLLIGLLQFACVSIFMPPSNENSVREYRLWNRDFETVSKYTGDRGVLRLCLNWICWGPDHVGYLISGDATVRSYLWSGMHERELTQTEKAARSKPVSLADIQQINDIQMTPPESTAQNRSQGKLVALATLVLGVVFFRWLFN